MSTERPTKRARLAGSTDASNTAITTGSPSNSAESSSTLPRPVMQDESPLAAPADRNGTIITEASSDTQTSAKRILAAHPSLLNRKQSYAPKNPSPLRNEISYAPLELDPIPYDPFNPKLDLSTSTPMRVTKPDEASTKTPDREESTAKAADALDKPNGEGVDQEALVQIITTVPLHNLFNKHAEAAQDTEGNENKSSSAKKPMAKKPYMENKSWIQSRIHTLIHIRAVTKPPKNWREVIGDHAMKKAYVNTVYGMTLKAPQQINWAFWAPPMEVFKFVRERRDATLRRRKWTADVFESS